MLDMYTDMYAPIKGDLPRILLEISRVEKIIAENGTSGSRRALLKVLNSMKENAS